VLALAIAVVVGVGARWAGQAVESHARETLRRAGVSAGAVSFSWLGTLRIQDAARDLPGGGRLTVDAVEIHWRLLGGADARSHVAEATLNGVRVARAPLTMAWREADFEVAAWERDASGERLRLLQRAPDGGEIAASLPARGADGADAIGVLGLTGLDLGGAEVQWNGDTVLSPGRWSGRATAAGTAARFESEGALHGDDVRVTPPRPLLDENGVGVPTAMDVEWTVRGRGDAVEIERLSARLAGLDVTGHGALHGLPAAREVDVALQAHCELAAAFRTAGLAPPLPDVRGARLGAASLDLTMRGPLADPAALDIEPRLRFAPEPSVVAALSYLRAPFEYRPAGSPGVVVDVRDGAPDFIPIDAVPPLFRKALLVSEDAGFAGHAGIDLVEIVAAWVENGEDGRRLRGASTITQQVVKNLLLSSERTYGRKLKEAALALMVDAVVPKSRLLEIYVNIIEWGPGFHGLVPAARHYFGKRPEELTPKEMAFLICLIPSPVRYHQAHGAGKLGPGMEHLVRNLLAKLRSVDAIDEEQYQQALAEQLAFAPEGADRGAEGAASTSGA
jgi:hypothetical protein